MDERLKQLLTQGRDLYENHEYDKAEKVLTEVLHENRGFANVHNMLGVFTVVAYNRTTEKVDQFLANEAKGTNILGAHSLAEMVALLKKPRRVMLMVKAGAAVDEFIEHLLGVLEPGDIIIDGGNSLFEDTIRRTKYVESKGLLYIGTGVSGGEEGARRGPSIMPGGSPAAWEHVKPIFQAIAAKVAEGSPCCDWVGEGGAGHYVKMTHNGIEYGDMQLICEAYQIMKEGLGMTPDEMHEVFKSWNEGELKSYLIEITRDILGKKDEVSRDCPLRVGKSHAGGRKDAPRRRKRDCGARGQARTPATRLLLSQQHRRRCLPEGRHPSSQDARGNRNAPRRPRHRGGRRRRPVGHRRACHP